MPKLNWDGNDFQDSQDSFGATSDLVSHGGNLQQGYRHGSLTEGLVAYYPMEKGQGEVLHDGALKNNGVDNTSAGYVSGKVGNYAKKFDDNDDNVDLGSNLMNLTDGDSITISAWARFTDFDTSDNPILSNWGGTTNQILLYENSNGAVQAFSNQSNSNSVSASFNHSLSTSTWYHFVAVFDSSGSIRLYKDGELKDENNSWDGTWADSNDNWLIGNRNDGRPHGGAIDDVRIYDRVLSEPEIKALFNEGSGVQSGVLKKEKDVPGQDEGGISCYKLNGTADDSWGNNDGTNNGADLTATGVYGQAANLNGTSDYIDLANVVDSEPRTISGWFRTENADGWIIAQEDNDEDFSDDFEFQASNLYTADEKHADLSLADDLWHSFTIVLNGANSKLYIDGKLRKKFAPDYNDLNDGNLVIGQKNGSNYFKGKIDDVRIYDKALTPVQVEKLYHKGAYRISRESTLQ